jgi:hypothetical protein
MSSGVDAEGREIVVAFSSSAVSGTSVFLPTFVSLAFGLDGL